MRFLLKNLEEILASIAISITVLMVITNVVLRYGFNFILPWSEELSVICFIWATYLGISSCYKHKLHMGVDVILTFLPSRTVIPFKLVISGFLLILNLYMAYLSYQYTMLSSKVTPVLGMSYFFHQCCTGGLLQPNGHSYGWLHDPGPQNHQRRAAGIVDIYLPIVILFVLFLLNVPIAFSLIASAMYYFLFINDSLPTTLVMQRFITSAESFPLLAIPFFIMVGSVMNYSGISRNLLAFADSLIGHKTGGLAHVNVILSTMMGGISGSANADAANAVQNTGTGNDQTRLSPVVYGRRHCCIVQYQPGDSSRHQPDYLCTPGKRFRTPDVYCGLCARTINGLVIDDCHLGDCK